jgi:flagellar FliL protein
VGALVVVLLLVGVGAFFFMKSRAAAAEDGGEEAAAPAKAATHAAPHGPPGYLPLDNMVVNLADKEEQRVAQVGITLEIADAHGIDTVKAVLPPIRSGILEKLSQFTAAELLSQEGKEKLKKEILREAAIPFGGGEDDEEDTSAKKKKKKVEHVEYPVTGVLFSSFIVQ